MNREQAKKLIRETFEAPFDKNNFIAFLKNLLKYFEEKTFVYQGNYIPDAFKQYISSLERIGQYICDGKEIDLLVVQLRRETSLERARTAQRNFIAWYLKGSRGGKLKDASLVAFVSPDKKDWRFSLVKMDYRIEETPSGKFNAKEEPTPARRWSFLVGKNEKSHTAQSRFVPILENDDWEPTLEDLEQAFNVEVVTKEFFQKYRDLFIRTKLELDKIVKNDAKVRQEFESKNINTVDFAKKLLGQITFLYFLQKKGWFGVARDNKWGSGPKHFLRELFEKKYENYKNFFNDILEPLFYEALRIDRRHDDDYYSRFGCKIPFLNGGLFDPINNYDWVHIDITLPNSLFSNSNKTKEGDTGDGILDVFDRYNFTVCEDEPLEKEVAIDPELLGKTYEQFNAIHSDNFDEFVKSIGTGEENKFNKSYGVYYTPREIVHYMCQQSLIEYLYTKFIEAHLDNEITKQDVEDLIELGELITEYEAVAHIKRQNIKNGNQKSSIYTSLLSECIRHYAKTIDSWLDSIAICDPAVGSGAFLVGMMTEIVRAKSILSVFLKEENNSSYEFKRHCIEYSLYGVDIDPGACEIAKLRLWLSLVVDEDDIRQIKPLPNLDYKIVCGDSLISVERNLFNAELFNQLESLKPLFFNETNPTKKQEYKKQIDELIYQITNNHNKFDFKIYFSEVFHEKGGFDIVIANPPYIQLQKDHGKLANIYKNYGFETFDRRGDIYTLFYEKGLQILNNSGHLTFISSNKWMRAGYGEKLRSFFLKYNPKILIDLGPNVFESATVDTNMLIIQKAKNQNQLKAVTITENKKDGLDFFRILKDNGVVLSNLTKDAWFIGNNAEQQLKEKIEHIGKPLKDWDVKIYRGIVTGLNEAFIIDSTKRQEILSNCKDEDERRRTEAIIKPLLRGRDIKRYYYEWAGLWVIGTFPALRLNINNYPAIKKYFLDYFDIRQLEQSGKQYPELSFNARKKTGNKWFETQDQIAYYHEFEKEKVIYSEIVREPQFHYDSEKFYIEATSFLMTGEYIKYICGLLNSKPVSFFFKQYYAGGGLGQEGYRYKKAFLEKLPLPPITSSNKPIVRQIEELVDKILAAKKQNPQADTNHWEREIDQLVYKLYGLTEEEIKIVEGMDYEKQR